jgi:subtilisin-like proprotein convertase family protein
MKTKTNIRTMPRTLLSGLLMMMLIGLGVVTIPSRANTSGPLGEAANPVQTENLQPGTSDWGIKSPFRIADDVNKQIKGYASATSVNKGQPIQFHISVTPVQTYTIDIYRMGWYNGDRGRLVLQSTVLTGTSQPACPTDATTGLIECNWTSSYSFTVPISWTSGIYLAKLSNAQLYQNYIVFTVRDDARKAAFLYQQPVTTYQAYNNYPNDNATGKSLYDHNSFGANTVVGSKRAVKVSFNRPYADNGGGNFDNQFSDWTWEIYLVGWLERMGYDVAYSTNVDTHVSSARLLNYKAFLSAGHDEYWTKEMFDAAEAARAAGVNLVFFAGNAVDVQMRFEPASDGTPNRTVVSYKNAAADPNPNPALKTVQFREAGRTQQTLLGVQYSTYSSSVPTQSLVIANTTVPSTSWVFSGTGLTDGATVPGLIGYEIDAVTPGQAMPISTTFTIIGNSPFVNADGSPATSHAVIYQAPSGAWVFSSGTTSFAWALDHRTRSDARIQKLTQNILNRFGDPVEPLPTIVPTLTTQPTPTTPPAACSQTTISVKPQLAIPDGEPAFTCVSLNAPDIGTVQTLTLGLGISHTYVSDLALRLRSPNGSKQLTLMNRTSRPALPFGSPANLLATYPITFAAAGIDAETMGVTLTNTNQVVCRDDGNCIYTANPDGDNSSTISSTAEFSGTASLGTWQLCAEDSSGGDAGTIETITLNLVCSAEPPKRLVYLPFVRK